MTAKQIVQQLLETMPETSSFEDIRRQIEFFEKLRNDQELMMLGASASFEIENFPIAKS